MGESLKADGKIPWALNLAQAAAGAFTVCYTDIFLANELKATSLSFSCVFKRGGGGFVIFRPFYMMLVPRRRRKILYAPKKVFH